MRLVLRVIRTNGSSAHAPQRLMERISLRRPERAVDFQLHMTWQATSWRAQATNLASEAVGHSSVSLEM